MSRVVKKVEPETPSLEYTHSEPSKAAYTPALVILLVIASFFLGSLYTKVQYLEKNGGSAKEALGAQTQNGTGSNQNQPSQTPTKVDVDLGHLPIKGNKDAKVAIVEFSDYQCPFCQRFFQDTLPSILKDYVSSGKVKLSYRHYPLPFHQNAHRAAEATECANDQGKFWEMHDLLFQNQGTWQDQADADAVTTFKGYATQLGIDAQAFASCLESGKFKKTIDDDQAAGQKAGVSGTPTFYINGMQLVGAQPYSAFKTIIDQELQKAK